MTPPHETARDRPNPDATDPMAGPALSGSGLAAPDVSPPRRPIVRTAIGLNADGSLRSGKLAGLTMNRAIWVLSWPILAESSLQSFVGLTDTFLSAQLSEAATGDRRRSYFCGLWGLWQWP